MDQVLFWIPIKTQWTPDGIPLYGFGTMLFIVLVVTTWLTGYRAERYGLPAESPERRKAYSERVRDLVLWTVLAGVVGARIFYMIQFPEQFDRPLMQFFQFWNGGIVFYGSALGGLLAALICHRLFLRQFNVSAWRLADIIAPSIAIGLALGRIGCFLNGCCWGHVACPDCVQVHFPMMTAPARDMLRELQTSAGFAMDPQGKDDRTVGAVEPGSAAESSGLQAGDVIVGCRWPSDCRLHRIARRPQFQLAARQDRCDADGSAKWSGSDAAGLRAANARSDPDTALRIDQHAADLRDFDVPVSDAALRRPSHGRADALLFSAPLFQRVPAARHAALLLGTNGVPGDQHFDFLGGRIARSLPPAISAATTAARPVIRSPSGFRSDRCRRPSIGRSASAQMFE